MHAIDDDYVTVDEAATLLRVAPSTIRRWIRAGDLPAYRLGKRRLAVRRNDLPALLTPLRPNAEYADTTVDIEELKHRKLTPEEVKRGLEALERVKEINKDIMDRRGGKPFESSVDIIREMREERLRELA